MPRRILTVNSGSSSVKYSVYQMDSQETCLFSGKIENLSIDAREQVAERLLDDLQAKNSLDGVTAIGYRIVHGGMRHSEPERITPELIDELKELVPLAPDHLPAQIAVIEALSTRAPSLTPAACFDTAFHRAIPRVAQLYGIPRDLADQGVVRYGFHGLSYAYVVEELRRQKNLPERTIIAHLGNGASMAALRGGVSVDTSMGLTPTGGFVMSTRSGDLDPGVILHLIRQRKVSPDEANELVTKQGGLKGLSGGVWDMRELESRAANDSNASEAIDVFCYQIRKFLGAYFAVLGGLDLLVFTGGIGENSARVRAAVCEGLSALGLVLDSSANRRNAATISADRSSVTVRIIPANEELMIARYTDALLRSSG